MHILHAYNVHRGIGGADSARDATLAALRQSHARIATFVRDSRDLPPGMGGRIRAFVGGIYAREAVKAMERRLHEDRPDILHVHELYPLISPWILPLAWRLGIRVFMSVYDYRLTCPIATHTLRGEQCFECRDRGEHRCVARNCRNSLPESLAYALRNAFARRLRLYTDHVDRFMTISRMQSDYLVDTVGVDPARIVLNPCVVPIPGEAVADPSLGSYVAYAGRFVREKGVETMVSACRQAGLPMAFAGDASSHPAVRASDRAQFVLTRSAEELARFYRGARMIVVPSIWPETFGMVAAEAMAHGIPVVASDIGALPDTVLDGRTGLLARPGDVADFADKISRIWHDADLARRLGQGAAQHVRASFSSRVHAERLMGYYRQALAGGA